MDSDDYCLPDRFEMQLNYLRKNNLDLIGSSVINRSSKKNELFNIGHNLEGKDIKKLSYNYVPIAHPTFFGKSCIFKKILYDEKLIYSQDYDFLVRCILNKYKVDNLNIPLLVYNNNICMNLDKVFRQIKISNEISRKYSLQKESRDYALNYKILMIKPTKYENKCLAIRNKILLIENNIFRKFFYLIFIFISLYSQELRSFNFRNIRGKLK